jgi:hypothetical protein
MSYKLTILLVSVRPGYLQGILTWDIQKTGAGPTFLYCPCIFSFVLQHV